MIHTNPSFKRVQERPPLRPFVPDTVRVTEDVAVNVLDYNGNPTDEYRTLKVTKKVDSDVMVVDQTLSADDLALDVKLANGIPLQDVNFDMSSEDPDVLVASVNSAVNQARNKFVDMSVPTANESTPNEPTTNEPTTNN